MNFFVCMLTNKTLYNKNIEWHSKYYILNVLQVMF